MPKALSVRIWRSGASLCRSMVRVMADSYAMLMVCRSSLDFISMWMVVPVIGLTIDAPSVGFPVFLSVRVDEVFGFQAAWNCLGESLIGVCGGFGA